MPDLQTLEYHAPAAPRRWHVGTLTYGAAGLAALFCWLLGGDLAWNVKERTIFPLAQVTLRGFAAPVWLVGLFSSAVPAAIGFLLGPSIGVMSDRYRSRWGRRIPFIVAATPTIMLAMLGLATTTYIAHWIHAHLGEHGPAEGVCRIAVFSLFWTLMEIGTVITKALFDALINDVVPRPLIGRFFGLFRLVGLAVASIFYFWLLGNAEKHAQFLFGVFGLIYSAGIIVMCFGVKEGTYPPPPPKPEPEQNAGGLKASLGRSTAWLAMYLHDCFGNPYYIWFFASITFGLVMFIPVNTFMLLHARSVGMSDALVGKCVGLGYVVSLILSYPLGILADRFHPVRLGILFTLLYAIVTGFAFFFGSTVPAFFIAMSCHTIISGCYITGTSSLAQRLLPPSRFAELASAAGVCSAIPLVLVAPLLGGFVQYRGGDYRYIFLAASMLAALGVLSHVTLLRKFLNLGGDEAYVAP